MKLYKYTTFDIGRTILESSYMALSKPECFNDPFDCIPVFEQEEQERAIQILTGYVMDQQIIQLMQSQKKTALRKRDRILARVVLKEFDFIRMLVRIKPGIYEPYLSFKVLKRMLHFLELIGSNSAERAVLKEKIEVAQSTIETQGFSMLKDLLNMHDRMYVGSLSATYESILMWSYYGKDHKGVCIELEIDENSEFLSKVQYQHDRPVMQTEKLLRNYCGQLFASKGEENANAVFLPLILQPYITKAEDWKHEQEYRLIYLEEAFEKEGIIKRLCADGCERYMCPVKISKVFCGANMSEENKDILRRIIPAEIEIVEMAISDAKYELLTQYIRSNHHG